MYLLITLFCGLFSFVYELFSHGVYSPYMVCLFVIPLLLGVLPHLVPGFARANSPTAQWQRLTQSIAVATLTIGSALQGIVEIYGTTSDYIVYYAYAGFGLLILSAGLWLHDARQGKHTPHTPAEKHANRPQALRLQP